MIDDPNEAWSAGYADGCADGREEAAAEIARLKAEVLEARNEAATVRRAYLHERDRADKAGANPEHAYKGSA